MLFNFKNLGIVESASIELKGLTIITGLNDTGKSFISKAIYSIVKTINDANEQSTTEKSESIRNLINQVFSSHRQLVPFTPSKLQAFNPQEITRKIIFSIKSNASKDESIGIIRKYIENVLDDINEISETPLKLNGIKRINEISSEIQLTLIDHIDDERMFKVFFDKLVIQKLFQGQINNLQAKDELLQIDVLEGVSELLKITVKDNKTQLFNLKNIFLVEDATIIETPTILQLAKFITTTLAFPSDFKKIYQQRTDLPNPYYDLLEKMNLANTISTSYSEIFNDIKSIIGGTLQYEIDEGAFVFVKDDGSVIKSFNIATGIKSLGLIQLLLNSGTVNSKTILIIDEPEVHLHPTWEVKYAKMLVSLSRLGIPIVISSHSPYFLKALTIYIKEYETQDITKVYFGEKNSDSGMSIFLDVTDDLDPIFKKLAEPMQDLLLKS